MTQQNLLQCRAAYMLCFDEVAFGFLKRNKMFSVSSRVKGFSCCYFFNLSEPMNIGQIIALEYLLVVFFHLFLQKERLSPIQMLSTMHNIHHELGIILSTSILGFQPFPKQEILFLEQLQDSLTSTVQHVILIWFFQGPTVIVFVI